jgi:phosphoglucomutase
MMIVLPKLHHPLYEVPVGFKWFVDGLIDGSLGFVGEESAGQFYGRTGTSGLQTDGFIPALLAAEMTATLGRDPEKYINHWLMSWDIQL